MDPQDFNTEEFQFPDKWDQDDNDFTALKNTMGFNLRPLGLMRRNYRKMGGNWRNDTFEMQDSI